MDWSNPYIIGAIVVYAATAVWTFIALCYKNEGAVPLAFVFASIFWLPIFLYYFLVQPIPRQD